MFLIFVEINECESNPCPENDNCADLIDGYSCVPKGIYQTIIKNSPFSIHLKMIVYTKVSGFPAGKSAGPVWEKGSHFCIHLKFTPRLVGFPAGK